ncbi:hypothetical protein IAT38_003382 [Cryptococcus sp. DSM 104549]
MSSSLIATTTTTTTTPRPPEGKASGGPSKRETSPTQPRDLTLAKLWAGWDLVTKDMLDSFLIKDSSIIPDRYSAQRLTYELMTPVDTAEQHILRTTKMEIHRDFILQTRLGEDEFAVLSKQLRSPEFQARCRLQKRLDDAVPMKEAANQLYRLGKYRKAALGYLNAWGYLMPYHTTGLSPDDPLRAELGNLCSTVWANVSASFIALSKKMASDLFYVELWNLWGYQSAWAAWELREYASASIVRNARLLAQTCQRPISKEPVYVKRFKCMREYWRAQAEALVDVPKGTLFKDLPEEKRLSAPTRDLTDYVGPRKWAGPALNKRGRGGSG